MRAGEPLLKRALKRNRHVRGGGFSGGRAGASTVSHNQRARRRCSRRSSTPVPSGQHGNGRHGGRGGGDAYHIRNHYNVLRWASASMNADAATALGWPGCGVCSAGAVRPARPMAEQQDGFAQAPRRGEVRGGGKTDGVGRRIGCNAHRAAVPETFLRRKTVPSQSGRTQPVAHR